MKKKIFINILVILILMSFIFLVFKKTYIPEHWESVIDSDIIELSKQLKTNKKWDNYRIGDVYHQGFLFYNNSYHENVLYHEKDYPGSIASEYITRNKPRITQNKKLLHDIIGNRVGNIPNIPNNTLILHIRIGDIICGKYGNNIIPWDILKQTYKEYYSKNGDYTWWKNLVKYINTNNIDIIYIIAGSHVDKCLLESAQYLENRRKYLIGNIPNIKVIFRVGQSPDEDIIFCKNTKHFISTGGGFGKLLKEINN